MSDRPRLLLPLAVGTFAIAGWTAATILWLSPPDVEIETKVIQLPAPPPPPEPPLPAFEALENSADFPGSSIGGCVLAADGTPLYLSPNATMALTPASALKAVTAATALEILGPEHVFLTRVTSVTAPDAEGVVDGALYLVGDGDPALDPRSLVTMAEALQGAGVRRVTGDVVADASVFPAAAASDHWNWGDVGNGYGAGAFGINLGHNRFVARFDPGDAVGLPVRFLGSTPPLHGIAWRNFVATGEEGSGDGVVIYGGPESPAITLRGTVPLGEPGFGVTGAIPSPPALAARAFREALIAAGIVVDGGPAAIRGAAPPDGIVLALNRSEPLPALLAHLLDTSDNLEAQCLFLTIGRLAGASAAAAVADHWRNRGTPLDGQRLLDGSGLARANKIRPIDLATVVHAARSGPQGQRFYDALPQIGNVRAKPGGMSGVRSEVGFAKLPDGREVTYAFVGNALPEGSGLGRLRGALMASIPAR